LTSRVVEQRRFRSLASDHRYTMDILPDVNQPTELRFEAAKSAAPYIHPRLAHVESKNETTLTKVVSPEPTTTEWEEEFTEQRPN
jgi:hypothetical protein